MHVTVSRDMSPYSLRVRHPVAQKDPFGGRPGKLHEWQWDAPALVLRIILARRVKSVRRSLRHIPNAVKQRSIWTKEHHNEQLQYCFDGIPASQLPRDTEGDDRLGRLPHGGRG